MRNMARAAAALRPLSKPSTEEQIDNVYGSLVIVARRRFRNRIPEPSEDEQDRVLGWVPSCRRTCNLGSVSHRIKDV